MMNQLTVALLLVATAFAGEQKPSVPAAGFDACSLVTSQEIQAVQGEAVTQAKPSVPSDAAFDVAQCFYVVQTFSRSVSLQLIRQRTKPGARSVREFWNERFHREERDEGDKDAAPKPGSARRAGAREEEEREGPAPQRVAGVGDEAFWAGRGITAALYVLRGDRILRVSLGGPEDEKTKIAKAKTLAADALRRM